MFNRAGMNSLKLRSDSLHSDTTLSLQSFVTMETSCTSGIRSTAGGIVILVAVANDALPMQL